jgi:hypothetical protein
MFRESWGDRLEKAIVLYDRIWTGLVASGQVTLLTGLWKAGKTTLLSHLLSRRPSATPLLDLAVRPGVTAVVSEESEIHWQPRCGKLGIGGDTCFLCRPFKGARPSVAEFDALIAHLINLRKRRGVDLVVFDSLSRLVPIRCENSAEAVGEGLDPLHRLTDAGMATLLMHHPKKGKPMLGQAARGSGDMQSFADILLELHPFQAGDFRDRRRLLLGVSRSHETPPSLLIELKGDGMDYTVLPEEADSDFPEYWPWLRAVLEDAPQPLTRREIHARWVGECAPPSARTLWTWLNTACARNLVGRRGTGRTNEPFEYWLPNKMAEWMADPIWCIVHKLPLPGAQDGPILPCEETAERRPSSAPQVQEAPAWPGNGDTAHGNDPSFPLAAVRGILANYRDLQNGHGQSPPG